MEDLYGGVEDEVGGSGSGVGRLDDGWEQDGVDRVDEFGRFDDEWERDGVDGGGVQADGDEEEEGVAGVSNGGEQDTEFLVQEAMTRLPSRGEVLLDLRPSDVAENHFVEEFMSHGCSCKRWGGKACSLQFTEEYVTEIRMSLKELTTSELDLVIMGQLIAFTKTGNTTSNNKHIPQERKRGHTTYYHQGKVVCQDVFRLLHGIGMKRLKNVS